MGEYADMSVAVSIARRVFDCEIEALYAVRDSLGESFEAILSEAMGCKGKIIVTGMGKSGHIARKIAATLASLGSCAIYLHPGECLHGDLGMMQARDVVIAVSYSGESEEIVRIIPGIKAIGAKLIAVTGNGASALARSAALTQVFPQFAEACSLGLAPTSSTTAALVYGDALAVAASEIKGFGRDDFHSIHPAGALGRNLTLRVADCMLRMSAGIHLTESSALAEAFDALCVMRWDILPVSDGAGMLTGELQVSRMKGILKESPNIHEISVKDYMEPCTIFVNIDEMAIDALRLMLRNDRAAALVLKDGQAVGLLRREDMLRQGLLV